MSTPLLEVEGLSVDIRTPGGVLHAVTDVSFSLGAGETLCIVGESGCGKTMTALSLMRLLPASASLSAKRLRLEGADLIAAGERELEQLRGQRMGMIFQDPMTALNPVYAIGTQLEEVYLRHRGGSRPAARERAVRLLERCGIAGAGQRLHQYPHELSGGLRQRVMIAMMLMCEPALLIADEPTTALDVTMQVQILQLLRSLQAEMRMGIVLITHNLGVVARIADRVAVMYAGQIVEQGTPARVFGATAHPYTRGLLAALPRRTLTGRDARLGSIPGIVTPFEGKAAGCGFRNRCTHAHAACFGSEVLLHSAAPDHDYRCLLPPDAATHVQHAVASEGHSR